MKDSYQKIKTLAQILGIVRRAKQKRQTVVTTNGCFDILHVGHVRNLEHAKSLGDILIVGINSDRSVRANKGKGRPIVPERERAEMLAALRAVDYVFIFGDKTPDKWLGIVKPTIHAKGGDRKLHQIVERETLKKIGTKLVLIPYIKNKSTSSILKRILSGNRR